METGAKNSVLCIIFFFNDTATTEIYTLSLHDALPISIGSCCLAIGLSESPGGTTDDRGSEGSPVVCDTQIGRAHV